MNRLAIAILLMSLTLKTFALPTLQLDMSFFLANPATNRTIKLIPQSPFPGNAVFVYSDSNLGTAYYTNAPYGLINGQIMGPPGVINFQVYIPTNSGAVINASNCLATGTATTYPAGQVAWAIETSDQRYQLSGTTLSNTFYPLYSNPSNYTIPNDVTNIVNGVVGSTGNFQPASATLTNLSATGAETNQIAAGLNMTATTNSGVVTLNATNQTFLTNGFGDIVYSNDWAYATTGALASATNGLVTASVTNGLVGYWVTNGLATTDYVDSAVSGLPGPSLTNGLATTAYVNAATNPLASISYVQSVTNGFVSQADIANATNGLVTASVTNGLATISYAQALTNPLATISYLNSSIASFVTQSVTNGLATIDYVSASTNLNAISASNTAALLISYSNSLAAIGVTNALANMLYAQYLNTNSAIYMNGFTYLPVNDFYFTVAKNIYWSKSGIWYFYDGANWDLYTPASGILYYLGSVTPVGNTYVTINGVAPAGSSYFTNWPISSYELGQITNVVNNSTLVGNVGGTVTNNAFSASGTNVINNLAYTIALNVLTNYSGPTNGVTAGAATNIANNTQLGNFLTGPVTNAQFNSVSSNYIIRVVWSNSVAGVASNSYSFFNTNLTVGVVATNGSFVGIGTNTSSFTVTIYSGSVDPNGTVSAPKGAIYTRFDGSSNYLYSLVNTNGLTGWQE